MNIGKRKIVLAAFVAIAAVVIFLSIHPSDKIASHILQPTNLVSMIDHRVRARATVAQRVMEYGDSARNRLRPYFERKNIPYPPAQVELP